MFERRIELLLTLLFWLGVVMAIGGLAFQAVLQNP